MVGPIMLVIGNGCNRQTRGRTGIKVDKGTIIDPEDVLRIPETVLLATMVVRDKMTAAKVFSEFGTDEIIEQDEISRRHLQRLLLAM